MIHRPESKPSFGKAVQDLLSALARVCAHLLYQGKDLDLTLDDLPEALRRPLTDELSARKKSLPDVIKEKLKDIVRGMGPDDPPPG